MAPHRRAPCRIIGHVLAALASPLLAGCEGYEPLPLTPAAVEEALTPPAGTALCAAARALKHPIIPPLALDLEDGLSAEEAGVLAVLCGPELRARRGVQGEAAAALVEAGLLPNPQLIAAAGPPLPGLSGWTFGGLGLGLSWQLDDLLLRPSRRDAAAARADAARLEVCWAEWQAFQAARAATNDVVALSARVECARAAERLLAQDTEWPTPTWHDAGPGADATEVVRGAIAAERLELEQRLGAAHLQLDHVLGFAPGTGWPVQAWRELPVHIALPPTEALLEGLEARRLDLLALRRGYDSQEAAVEAAVLAQFPRVTIGFTHARDTGSVVTSGFGITIDLPLFDRRQRQLAAARATRQRLFDEYVARVFEARADIARLLQTIPAIERRIAASKAQALVLARRRHQQRQALDAGQPVAAAYAEAVRQQHEEEQQVIALERDLVQAAAALELSAGVLHLER